MAAQCNVTLVSVVEIRLPQHGRAEEGETLQNTGICCGYLWIGFFFFSQETVFCISVMRSGSDIANNYKQVQIIVSHGEPTIYPHC
jgi:hypothetical protein